MDIVGENAGIGVGPDVLNVGAPARLDLEDEAFQEMDYRWRRLRPEVVGCYYSVFVLDGVEGVGRAAVGPFVLLEINAEGGVGWIWALREVGIRANTVGVLSSVES